MVAPLGKSKRENQILTDTQFTPLSLGSVEGNELQECKLQRDKVLDREERQSEKPLIWSGCYRMTQGDMGDKSSA